jgi:hypothetical protein
VDRFPQSGCAAILFVECHRRANRPQWEWFLLLMVFVVRNRANFVGLLIYSLRLHYKTTFVAVVENRTNFVDLFTSTSLQKKTIPFLFSLKALSCWPVE